MSVSSLQAATDVLDRADALLTLDVEPTPEAVRADIRRMAWALGSAAIDTYFHWRVRTVDLGAEIPKALKQLSVTFGDLLESGNKSVDARQRNISDRPTVRARNALHREILIDSYQSVRGIEKALSLVGAKKYWEPISSSLGESVTDIKTRLNTIANRRNRIVHEGDIKRLSKPQRITHDALEAGEVEPQLAWIRSFLSAVDSRA